MCRQNCQTTLRVVHAPGAARRRQRVARHQRVEVVVREILVEPRDSISEQSTFGAKSDARAVELGFRKP
jgi:hypothetical protein